MRNSKRSLAGDSISGRYAAITAATRVRSNLPLASPPTAAETRRRTQHADSSALPWRRSSLPPQPHRTRRRWSPSTGSPASRRCSITPRSPPQDSSRFAETLALRNALRSRAGRERARRVARELRPGKLQLVVGADPRNRAARVAPSRPRSAGAHAPPHPHLGTCVKLRVHLLLGAPNNRSHTYARTLLAQYRAGRGDQREPAGDGNRSRICSGLMLPPLATKATRRPRSSPASVRAAASGAAPDASTRLHVAAIIVR